MKLPIILAALVLIACGLFMAQPPALGQEPHCFTVEEAVEIMKRNMPEVFGDLPFKDGRAVYYRWINGDVFAAPIVDGCVSPVGERVPGFVDPALGTQA